MVATRTLGRGRPTQMYRLSKDINRNNLVELTCAALNAWFANITEFGRSAAFTQIAVHLTSNCNPPVGGLTQKLTYAIRYLNDMNYGARWEAHIDAPRILITHCPYAAVVSKYPEICQVDAYVMQNVLGQSVTKIPVMERYGDGEVQCIFRLNQVTVGTDL
jgi:predicted ArsR family transcriptional regulator